MVEDLVRAVRRYVARTEKMQVSAALLGQAGQLGAEREPTRHGDLYHHWGVVTAA